CASPPACAEEAATGGSTVVSMASTIGRNSNTGQQGKAPLPGVSLGNADLTDRNAVLFEQHGVPGLDHIVDQREPLVERDESGFGRVDRETLQGRAVVPEGL